VRHCPVVQTAKPKEARCAVNEMFEDRGIEGRLVSRQTVDHADIGSWVSSHHTVRLEGDEPALIPALGGNLSAFQLVVRVVPVRKGIKVDDDDHARSHEPQPSERVARITRHS
jgi:hypothetical protein